MTEHADDVLNTLNEFISFLNQQIGMYIDALAGFAGHHTQIELQMHRVNRPVERRIEDGMQVVVWASYEDSTKPQIIHNRIIRASDYLKANSPGGSNEQQHARAILIFIFTFWEDVVRPGLASIKNVDPNQIKSNIIGDLRILRHAILHAKGIVRKEEHRRLKVLGSIVQADNQIHLPHEAMKEIFILINQDCAKLMFEWLDVEHTLAKPEDILDFAIQRPPTSQGAA